MPNLCRCLLLYGALSVTFKLGVALNTKVLSESPLLLEVSDFASVSECADILKLVDRCREGWSDCEHRNSTIKASDLSGDKPVKLEYYRKFTSYVLTYDGEKDEKIDPILRRAHGFAHIPMSFGERVQLATHEPGDYFSFHHDRRVDLATFLLYLNDVERGAGGETIFPMLRAPDVADTALPPLPQITFRTAPEGPLAVLAEDIPSYCDSDYYLKVRPKAGAALLFFPYLPNQTIDTRTYHGSCPLKEGSKAVIQRWMTEAAPSMKAWMDVPKPENFLHTSQPYEGGFSIAQVAQDYFASVARVHGSFPSLMPVVLFVGICLGMMFVIVLDKLLPAAPSRASPHKTD